MTMISPEQFKEKMTYFSHEAETDSEVYHELADLLMCEILVHHGYVDGVVLFCQMKKLYK